MAQASQQHVQLRRQKLIALMLDAPQELSALRAALKPRPSVRTLRQDLAWLEERFPGHVTRSRQRTPAGGFITAYHWPGPPPLPLQPPIEWALQEEIAGLVFADALLHQAQGDSPMVLSRLLSHPQLRGMAGVIARRAVQISTFGTEPMASSSVALCIMAILAGQGLELAYENRQGNTSTQTVRPLRMVLIRNEWYCLAWRESLRSYRLSRIHALRVVDEAPAVPASVARGSEIDDFLHTAFFATASNQPEDLVTVQLAVGPDAWPQVRGRRWGAEQVIEERPADLPSGWKRIRFRTAGLMECRHWVLSMGADARAEEPPELVEWLADQARRMLGQYPQMGTG